MLIDSRELGSASPVEADVCIIGAGAAGITLARALLGSSRKICLVESGGLREDKLAASLNAGANLGLPYHDLAETRERRFGGTTATWSGRCVPLDPIDFKVRPWVEHSGWPIGHEAMLPYFRRASDVCRVGESRYDAGLWADTGLPAPPLDPDIFDTPFWRLKALRFGETYRAELRAAANIRVLLNATVTALHTDADRRRISHADARSLTGSSFRIRARRFVLATGGIENARLLLASDEEETGGIGNRHDLVGRFFMEHPKCRVARVQPTDAYALLETWRKHFPFRQPALWPTITATAAAQERHGILNSSLGIYYRSLPGVTEAALAIWKGVKLRRWPERLPSRLAAFLPVLDEAPANLVRRFVRRHAMIARPEHVYLLVRGEQAPNPDSRVVLSQARDALGQRRADVDWRLSGIDHRTVGVLTQLFAKECARLGWGTVEPDDWLSDPGGAWPLAAAQQDHHEYLQGGNHHIGTTRMADDPRRGVVDADCRVHGKENLWIAGSSVFPTAGWANPTLSIVALTLRLGDHLGTMD